MPGKTQQSSDDTNLKQFCEAYKTCLQQVLSDKLIPKLTGNGLSKVTIKDADVQEFGKIRNRIALGAGPGLTATEIHFIANKVITKDPSPEFSAEYPDLSALVRRYHAVNALLKSVGDMTQFRVTYRHNFRDLVQGRDVVKDERVNTQSERFFHAVAKKLGAYAPNLAFFSKPKTGVLDSGQDAVIEEKLQRRASKSQS